MSRKSHQRDAEEQSNIAETHESSAVEAYAYEAGQRYSLTSAEDQARRVPWCCRRHSHRVEALVPARDTGTDSWQGYAMLH